MQQSTAKLFNMASARASHEGISPNQSDAKAGHILAFVHNSGAQAIPVKPAPIRSWLVLVAVVLAHTGLIYLLLQHQVITPPQLEVQSPMMVSLIAPPAPKPAVVPVVEPPKPVVKPKPKLKEVEKIIKPTEKPVERPVEATTETVAKEPPVETPVAVVPPVTTAPELEAPPVAKPVVEEKIEPPKFGVSYLNNPAPIYPKMSRRVGEEGRVILRVLVSESGTAETVTLEKSSGFVRLDEAAQAAVKQWRFIPARKNNQNLSAQVLVPIKFSLEN